MLLVPLPSQVGGNLTATRRCDTTTPANPSDGRSGNCAPTASRQLPGNQHGKRKKREEKEGAHHRKTSPTPLPRELERDAAAWKNSQGKAGLRGALACWHSGLRVVAQVRVCSSQTRNLSLSFSELSQLVVFKPLNDQESPTQHDTLRVLSQLRLASLLTLDVPLFRRHPRTVCCCS